MIRKRLSELKQIFCVEIENNTIKSVTPNNPHAKAIDAKTVDAPCI